MTGNCHVPCGVGEKLGIISSAYLLLTLAKYAHHFEFLFFIQNIKFISDLNCEMLHVKLTRQHSCLKLIRGLAEKRAL
jgi:hypothetical protein